MDVKLTTRSGAAQARTFHMKTAEMVIGRMQGSGLRIPSAAVSRRHCKLTFADEILRVEDLGSANGTIVNNRLVTKGTIKPGDLLTVGPVTFEVQYPLTPAALDRLLHEESREMSAAPVQEEELPEAIELGEPSKGALSDLELPGLRALEELEKLEEGEEEKPKPKKKEKKEKKKKKAGKKPAESSEASPDYSVMMKDEGPWAPDADNLRDLLSRLEDEAD